MSSSSKSGNYNWHKMFSFLKNHLFAVQAFFESSIVFTFAIPKSQVRPLIPECLELDTFDDKWAFIAVAMVQTKSLRPYGLPRFFGNDFFLIGYRVFVRFTNDFGKNKRGLYILKSETDKKQMEFLGNIFTHYKYTTTDIQQTRHNSRLTISSEKSGFSICIDDPSSENITLPSGSPFTDWKEAKRYAGPLPYTFTYNPVKKTVLTVEGIRENWKPTPVKVNDQQFLFIDEMKFKDARLASAFIIRNIPYYWKKGKKEKWSRKEENFRER